MRRLLVLVVTAIVLAGADTGAAVAAEAPTSGIASTPSGQGYWRVGQDGGVFTRGDAGFFGSMGGRALNAPVLGIAPAPNGQGYWLAGADGGVFAFGPGAPFHGSMGGQPLNAPIVGIAAAPGGNGYWLVGADGGVFAFGPGAPFFGSMGGRPLNAPIVGIAAAPNGQGYWLVGADGGVFSFGPGAAFFGSRAGQPLNAPIVAIAAAPGGDGYWLAAADGGVFAFGPGAGFFGSTGDGPIASRIAGIARTANGGGYWLADVTGGVYSFGSAPVLQPPPPRPQPPPTKPAFPPQPETGPPPSLGGSCQTNVRVRNRAIWSRCLRPVTGGFRSTEPIRVAGIDIAPQRGKDVLVRADGRIISDDASVSLTATGPLLPNVLPDGRLVLRRGGGLDITLGAPTRLDLSAEGVLRQIGGLPLVAEAGVELDWTDEGAELKVAVSIGRDFVTILPPVGVDSDRGGTTLKRGFGVEVELSTRNETGVRLDRLKGTVSAGKVYAALAIEDLSIEFDAIDKLWIGGATIVPFSGPLARHALPKVKGEIGVTIEPLGFGRLALSVTSINKPIGPYVFLQSLGGAIIRVPAPWTIRGEGGFSIGPRVKVPFLGTFSAAEAQGSIEWTSPARVSSQASIKLLGQRVAAGSVTADLAAARGEAEGHLSLAIRGNGFVGRMKGWLQEGRFALSGKASVRVFGRSLGGGEAFISSRGLGGCYDGPGPDYGFTVDFSKDGLSAIDTMAWGCDFNGLLPTRQPRQAGSTTQRFVASQGSRGVLVRVRAVGGAPSVVLRGGGREYVLPAGVGLIQLPELTALRDDENAVLWIVLNSPAAGAWTLDPLPGGLPLQNIETAEALPPPALRGRVRRLSRGRYELRWSSNAVRGQRVGFVERGPDGLVRSLTRSADARGRIRFRPAPGPAGVRTIVGAVELGGALRELRDVATLRLRAPVRPARPGRVRLRRSRGSVVVTWRGVRGAAGYVVSLRLRDGRRFERFVGARSRRLALTGVRRRTGGRVGVRAFTRSVVVSRTASAPLRRR